QAFDRVAHPQDLEHPDPPAEPGMGAGGAAGATLEGHAMATDRVIEVELFWRWLVGAGTLWADPADESLRQDAAHRGRHHERFDAHLEEAVDGTRGIGGMERGENEVAGQRRLHRDLGRLLVAALAPQ